MRRILLVDDEENVLKSLKRLLRSESYEVEIFTNPYDALQRARDVSFDLVVSDYRMPEMDGVSFLKEFRQLQPDVIRLILLSAYPDLSALIGAINEAPIFRFISKPWNEQEFTVTLKQALEFRDLLLENQRLADQVREQQGIISRQEREHPAIAHVDRDADGATILDDEDL